MTPPEPADAIPDFLLEEFDELSSETLRGIADYAREETYTKPDEMPDSMSTALALQDDETVAAIADYADSLAEFLADRDANSLRDITGNPDDEEEKWGHKRILEWHGGGRQR